MVSNAALFEHPILNCIFAEQRVGGISKGFQHRVVRPLSICAPSTAGGGIDAGTAGIVKSSEFSFDQGKIYSGRLVDGPDILWPHH